MREILFRGKRKDNGEWVCGDLVQLHDGRRYIVNNIHGACLDDKGNFINTEEPFVCEVDPSTVGQYTGLKDKYGKRIFEGDIVKLTYRDEGYEIGPIMWSDIDMRYKFASQDGTAYGIDVTNGYEVIGNIHDNPELLEAADHA